MFFHSLLYNLLRKGKGIELVLSKRFELLFEILEVLLGDPIENEVNLNLFFLNFSETVVGLQQFVVLCPA